MYEPGSFMSLTVIAPGDTTKADPYTIAIVSNPALETPINAGTFIVDPVMTAPAAFNASVTYIVDCLFGRLPGQSEALLNEPPIGPFVRIVSLRITGLPATDANALVAHDNVSSMLIARRAQFAAFLIAHGV